MKSSRDRAVGRNPLLWLKHHSGSAFGVLVGVGKTVACPGLKSHDCARSSLPSLRHQILSAVDVDGHDTCETKIYSQPPCLLPSLNTEALNQDSDAKICKAY